jgi:hypothetical protein
MISRYYFALFHNVEIVLHFFELVSRLWHNFSFDCFQGFELQLKENSKNLVKGLRSKVKYLIAAYSEKRPFPIFLFSLNIHPHVAYK